MAFPFRIIVIIEKRPWQTSDGGWARTYCFADGRCEMHKTQDGNFAPWESRYIMSPADGKGQSK
jgi:hypothetical protein